MSLSVTVIDADLINPADPLSKINVWYSWGGERGKLEQMKVCGHAFHQWLPISYRAEFAYLLEDYWHNIHPFRRDLHVAAYLVSLLDGSVEPAVHHQHELAY